MRAVHRCAHARFITMSRIPHYIYVHRSRAHALFTVPRTGAQRGARFSNLGAVYTESQISPRTYTGSYLEEVSGHTWLSHALYWPQLILALAVSLDIWPCSPSFWPWTSENKDTIICPLPSIPPLYTTTSCLQDSCLYK